MLNEGLTNGGLGEAVGLLGFGRDITGFGEIDFEVTDVGFGEADNGLGDAGFGDEGFAEAGLTYACFGEVGKAELVEFSDDWFAIKVCLVPVESFPSAPICFTKLGVTGFRPALFRVVL